MELTTEQINKKITRFENGERERLNKLYEYYIGKHAILNAQKKGEKPNNRLVVNYPKNIVNNTTGYYLGVPVSYSSDDDALSEQITDITQYNDDAFHNVQLGKDISVFGKACEIIYIDDDANIRYAKINPMKVIIGRSDDIERRITYAVRWYDVRDDDNIVTRYYEQYTEDKVLYYHSKNGSGIILDRSNEHYFGDVPVNLYENNEDCRGDYEDALSLIDAYNLMQSESVNDFQKFADAMLLLKDVTIDDATIKNLRDNNILETFGSAEASWLVKSVNDTYVENIKNRLEKDIYMTTATVNLSDDNFANNTSGVAIKYKLMCMENRTAVTERYFKKGLQRRFELICNLLAFMGSKYNYTDIDITFVRNIPVNLQETAALVQQLSGTVSKKTLLQQLPFVDDVNAELTQLEEENGEYQKLFNQQNNVDVSNEDKTTADKLLDGVE